MGTEKEKEAETTRQRQLAVERMTADLTSAVDKQMRAVTDRVSTFGEAIEKFSNRLSGMFPSGGGSTPAGATAAAGAAASASGGVMLVRVVNEVGSPVPVSVIGKQESGMAGVAPGIGGFIGGLVGGFVGGLAAPFMLAVVGAELIAAIATAIPLVIQIKKLVGALENLMHGFFNELHRAGILPATRLVALALVLVDSLIRIVLFYVQSLLGWAVTLLSSLANWVGKLINALGTWVSAILAELANYLSKLIPFIVREFVASIMGALAIGAYMIKEVFLYGVDLFVRGFFIIINKLIGALNTFTAGINNLINGFIGGINGLISALNTFINSIPGMGGIPAIPPISSISGIPAISPLDVPEVTPWETRFKRAQEQGTAYGRSFAETYFPKPDEKRVDPNRPTFKMPEFGMPGLELPGYQAPGSALDQVSGAGVEPRTPGAATAPPHPGETARPVTLTGGIHVQINAQTLDEQNAAATGRAVAGRIYEELARLIETDRFRRGLPTSAIA